VADLHRTQHLEIHHRQDSRVDPLQWGPLGRSASVDPAGRWRGGAEDATDGLAR
jgi:hypothetical protein